MTKTLTRMFSESYKDVKLKFNEFWKKFIIFTILIFSSVVLITTTESSYSTIKIWLNLPSETDLDLFFTILGYILAVVSLLLIWISAKLRPSEEEWTFLYSYQAVKNLEKFLDNPKLKFLKKRASRKVKRIFSRIDYWSIGNLEFINNQIGEPFDNYKNNFKNKINSIIKHGSKEDINNLIPFFHQLLHFLKMDSPKIDDFLKVTNNFEGLKTIQPKIKQLEQFIPNFDKFIGFINKYKIIKHIIHFVIIGVISYIAYYIGTCIENVGPGNSYTAGVAVFVGFTILKLTKIKKR